MAPGPVPYSGAPVATFQGGIQPPVWDPYGTPGNATTPLFPQDPFLASPLGAMPPMTKFFQGIHLEHHWLARDGTDGFGTNDSEISATFAFPIFNRPETPLLITPGFALHLWDGPPSPSDLPAQAYDAYLDAAWNPQLTPWLGAEFEARVGVFSDFKTFTTRSIRVPARGEAVLTFSPSFQIKAGVWYIARNDIKLLPAGGIIWTPEPDTRFEILFPNPRFMRRLSTIGTTDWWWYVRGEYGGGAWTIQREAGFSDRIDYNDIRLALGLEFRQTGGLSGFFEVGAAFDREIIYYETPATNFDPTTTVFLGAGVTF